MQEEFAGVGVNYSFIDAYDWDSAEVQDLMNSGFVVGYPPCFRCGKNVCSCENKCLIPPQIGNWLSHIKVWKLIAEAKEGLNLVCEDDIVFLDSYQETLAIVLNNAEFQMALNAREPLLLRLGWALNRDHEFEGKPHLNTEVRMSNPCYAITPSMAGLLLSSLKQIDTTSDVYLHRIVGQTVKNFTAIPPLAHDLSWSTGDISSEIRPKQNHIDVLKQELNDTDPNKTKYMELVRKIEYEKKRITAYQKFNKRPVLDGWRPRE